MLQNRVKKPEISEKNIRIDQLFILETATEKSLHYICLAAKVPKTAVAE